MQGIFAGACRNQGDFQEAARRYDTIIKGYISPKSKITIDRNVMASYAETLCELGRVSQGIEILITEIEFHATNVGTRIYLALANAWLMKYLLHYHKSDIVD